MKIIYLVRHGLTVANHNQIVQGQSDYPLADEGRHQSMKLARFFSGSISRPVSILSSPLMRARETAEIIAEQLNCIVEYDDLLMERRLGRAQGVHYETVRTWFDEDGLPSPFEPIHGNGESWFQLYLRAGQALLTMMDRPPGTLIVVSHGGFLNAVLRAILGISPANGRTFPPNFHFDNTGYAKLEFAEQHASWQILCINATPHLNS